MSKKQIQEGEEFMELGVSRETGEEFLAEGSFLLPVKPNAPMTSIPIGAKLILSRETGQFLFYGGKARPLRMGEVFEVIRPVQKIGPDGTYINLDVGDIIKLDPHEAVELMRAGQVKERKEEIK
jgi:hypothetical protein